MTYIPSLGFPAGSGLPETEVKAAKKKVHGWGRSQKLKAFGLCAARVETFLGDFPKPMWRFKPTPANWCVGEVLWHLADQEANLYLRLRKAVAEPGEAVSAWDQDKWSAKPGYLKADFNEALGLLKALRKANVGFLKRLPPKAWASKVNHPEAGRISVEYMVGQNIWHVEHHIGQMAKRYAEWEEKKK